MDVGCALDQGIFRVLLEAMSRPGRRLGLPGHARRRSGVPGTRVLATLLDHEVGFAVVGPDAAGLEAEILAATGARPVPVEEASFLVVIGPSTDGVLRSVSRGLPESPERGATVFYLLRDGDGVPPGGRFVLRGPGIPPDQPQPPEMPGLYRDELRLLREVNGEFPLGVDAFFVDRESLMALPRSVSIAEA